jgi:hypothetical protein
MVFESLESLKATTVQQEFRVLRRALNAAISARLWRSCDTRGATTERDYYAACEEVLGLYSQLYFDNIGQEEVCMFLRELLRHLRGQVIVVLDNSSTHKGAPLQCCGVLDANGLGSAER